MFQPSIPSLLLQKRSSVFVMLQKCHENFKTLLHKELSAGVLKKKCFENMPQIYRRKPMPKCDFNKFAKQLCWNHTSAIVPSCKFAANFQNTFSWEHLWRLQGFVKYCENVFTLVFLDVKHFLWEPRYEFD